MNNYTSNGSSSVTDEFIIKLKTLMMQAPAAVALLKGPDHIYTFVNLSYQKLYSRSETQLIGRSLQEVFPEIAGQGIYELFHKVYRTGEPFSSDEFPAKFEDAGSMRTGYYNFTIQPVKDALGKVSDLMVHAYEVTRQVEACKKAEENEAKYRSLFDNMDHGCCVVNVIFNEHMHPIDYRFLEVNKMFEDHTGLTDAAGKTAKELLPGIEQRWIDIYGKVATTGNSAQFSEGSEAMGRWFDVNAFRIGSNSSRKVAIIFTDVTTRKKSELETQETKNLLQAVYDSAPNSIAVMQTIYNKDGSVDDFRIRMLNQVMQQVIGNVEFLSKRYSEVFPTVRPTGILDKFKEVALTGVSTKFEQWYQGEGMKHWFRFSAARKGELLIVMTEDITNEKFAEKERRESEERFAAAVEAVEGVVWTNSPDGKMEGLQPGWSKLTGQRYEEYQGYGWAEAVHPDDAEPTIEAWNEAVRLKKIFEFEHRIKTADGEWRNFFIRAIPLNNIDGSIRQWVGVHTDVTEQLRAQEAIKASESRFQNLVRDATAAIVVLIGTEMKVEIANEAYGRLIDLKPADFLGKPIFSVIPQAAEHYLPILEKVTQTGDSVILYDSPYSGVVNGKKIEGYLHIVSQPYRNSEGKILGVMQIIQDVTESVKAKKALEESEAKFRSLIEEAPIATALFVGRELRIEVANDTFIQYMGKGRLVIGKPYIEALPELEGQGFFEKLDEVFMTGRTYEEKGASASIIVDGVLQARYFDFIVKPLIDSDGKVYALINIAADVTERVKAEQELQESESRFRNLSMRLEEEIELRTLELKQSNENLQQFAHVASHDLKEPVRKIKTFANLLQAEYGDRLEGKGTLYIEKVQHSTDRMGAMIDGVLRYSSINATELAAELVDLNEALENIKSDLEIVIQQKGAKIIHQNLPRVEGAKVLLYQLLYNLINNSLKFGKQGQPIVIKIEAEIFLENEKDAVRIIIADNGIGFDPRFSDTIFETFSRLNPKDKFEGTGLGLALCKKIVSRHSGKIEATGALGEGASFTIVLPLKQAKNL